MSWGIRYAYLVFDEEVVVFVEYTGLDEDLGREVLHQEVTG